MVLRGVGFAAGVGDVSSPVCETDHDADHLAVWSANTGWRVSPQSGLSLLSINGSPLIPVMSNRLRLKLGAKRMLDIIASICALVMLAPVFFVIAMRIKAEPRVLRWLASGVRG